MDRTKAEKLEWNNLVKKYRYRKVFIQDEYGIFDFSEKSIKDIQNGQDLSYEEYLQILYDSRYDKRRWFEDAYYTDLMETSFKGKITKFDTKRGMVLFNSVDMTIFHMDGSGSIGREDHVWMDAAPFEKFHVGDCVSFSAEIYRYLKTGNKRQISYGLRNPSLIRKIEKYELPTNDDLIMQFADQVTCEVCMYKEYCYGEPCLAEEWRSSMRNSIFLGVKNETVM